MLASILIVLLAMVVGILIWKHNGTKRRFRERKWAIFILLIGTVYMVGQALRFPLPNPADWIMAVCSPISNPIISWIKEGSVQK
ncbi:hypothetical protein FHS15_004563 [Paenibacillus castaneae]|nr:hypothetical protein [Paenibacillus castaneae]NIK79403.1 hypothetical protein [Paenibacillus castaneae]